MNRTALLASGAALTLVTGSVVAASTALASGTTHTLVLHGTSLSTHALGKHQSYEVEANTLHQHGRVVGYSTDSCFVQGHGDVCSVTYALKGGDLYGHLTFPITSGTSSVAKGKITGGLGRYAGAKGTIKLLTTGPNRGTITLKYTH